jgi:RNA-binding protein Nova
VPSDNLDAKSSSPWSPTHTTKTEDADSASISASTSPAPSSSSTTTHASPSPQSQVSLKLLLSNAAAGLIIGRSGSTISDLQAKSLTRIKLSQGGDYFPGTSDRVCLIQGSLQNVSSGVEIVLAKLYELQSLQHLSSTPFMANAKSSLPDESASTSFNVRLLIPSTCCGLIIGHGGSNIKTLKDKSEVTFIQLSPKEYEATIGERIMTITGPNFSSCANCVQIILNDMALNPVISRYINMTTNYSKKLATVSSSYADASSSGFFSEHESFQHQVVSQSQLSESRPRYGVSDHDFIPGQFLSSSPGADESIGLFSNQLLQQQGSPAVYDPFAHGDVPLPLLGDPSTIIQSQSYGDSVMSSPPEMIAFGPLSSSFPQYPPPVLHPMRYWPPYYSSTPESNIPSSASENLSPVDQLGQNFSTQASLQSQFAGEVTFVFGIPDTKISSIIGHGGKTLSELQALSHTKIQIQCEYIPRTQNRIMTITGIERDIEHAKHLVRQCLTGAFSRSNSLSELRHLKDV